MTNANCACPKQPVKELRLPKTNWPSPNATMTRKRLTTFHLAANENLCSCENQKLYKQRICKHDMDMSKQLSPYALPSTNYPLNNCNNETKKHHANLNANTPDTNGGSPLACQTHMARTEHHCINRCQPQKLQEIVQRKPCDSNCTLTRLSNDKCKLRISNGICEIIAPGKH